MPALASLKQLTMIRGNYDIAILKNALAFKKIQQSAELVIQAGNVFIISAPETI